MRILTALCLLALPAVAQHLHFGVKGGVPLNDLVKSEGNISNLSSRWVLGPTLDLDLPLGLGAELDLFYRRIGYSAAQDLRTSAWELPLLLKYRFPGVIARPYVGAGYVFRNIGDIPRLAAGSRGGAFAGGIAISAPVVRISPEIRWTRWGSGEVGPTSIRATRNQFEVLLGLTF